MQPMRILFALLLFLSASWSVCAQSKLDSLTHVLNKTEVDSVKIAVLHELFYEYEDREKAKDAVIKSLALAKRSKNKKKEVDGLTLYAGLLVDQVSGDSAIAQYQKALALATDIHYNLGISEALIGIGNCYWRKGAFDKAKEYQLKNITFCERIEDEEGVASSYNNLGNIYTETRDFTKAMEYYTLASQRYYETGNEGRYAITLANIGMIQSKLENYASAIEYYQRSDSLFMKVNNKEGRGFVLYSLSIDYRKSGAYDKAVQASEQALEIYQQVGNLVKVSEVYYGMGNLAYEKGAFEHAIACYKKSDTIAKKIGHPAGQAYAQKAIGDCYHELKNPSLSKEYLYKAIGISDKINLSLIKMDAYETLTSIYAGEGNYKKAFESQQHFAIIHDSLYTKEKADLAAEIEANYQNKQKSQEIALLAAENNVKELKIEQSVFQRNSVIAFAAFLLLLAVLFYNQYRVKQKANKKLQELDRLKSNFFTNISHEFRTPLTLIRAPIEQLEKNPQEQLSREHIKMIGRNSDRLLNLVDQLLDLAKIDEGSMKLAPAEDDLYARLRTAAASFHSLAAGRDIDYRIDIPSQALWAAFDRDKLEKITYNLLSNAFKFTDDGGVIIFEARQDDQLLTVQVSDTGKGIPEEKLPFIFDRFYQADTGNTRQGEGSGIGLSLTKSLTSLMGGTVTVSSEVNKGTFFTVTIPVQAIKIHEMEVTPHETPSVSASSRTLLPEDARDVPSVLLVEDNPDMRHFIKEQLIQEYRIEEALHGVQGFTKAVDQPPDLIITDLMMPEMDGLELCKKLKTNLSTSHIPIIVLTAKAGVENKIEGLETGADEYLVKPFNVDELLVRVRNLIAQRKKLRELFASEPHPIAPEKITVTSLDQKFIEDTIALLEKRFSDPDFGVSQMQEELGMSKTQLHRKLRALTNEAPGELLRNFRLKRAAQLIRQNSNTVTQIAFEVGFNNPSYFTKCFRELYGMTPSAYQDSR